MAGKVDGIALGALGAGGLLLYAGISGKDLPAAAKAIISGKSPQSLPTKYPITGTSLAGGIGGLGVVSAGGYVNPFSEIQNLVPERVDMGVDFSGTGPVLAIGSGTITNVSNFGWPNNTFICIHLDSGAYAGLYAYFAEDIQPSVRVGQKVAAGDVIGVMFDGGSGIECGWAAPPGIGATMAAGAGQFGGTNTTAYGASFNKLLTSVGVPSGTINNTPTGTVGAGYP